MLHEGVLMYDVLSLDLVSRACVPRNSITSCHTTTTMRKAMARPRPDSQLQSQAQSPSDWFCFDSSCVMLLLCYVLCCIMVCCLCVAYVCGVWCGV